MTDFEKSLQAVKAALAATPEEVEAYRKGCLAIATEDTYHADFLPIAESGASTMTTPYPQPACRMTATYPATDGTVPESMDIEWAAPPSPNTLRLMVEAFAAVAGNRGYSVEIEPPTALKEWAKTPTSFALAEQEEAALAEKYSPGRDGRG